MIKVSGLLNQVVYSNNSKSSMHMLKKVINKNKMERRQFNTNLLERSLNDDNNLFCGLDPLQKGNYRNNGFKRVSNQANIDDRIEQMTTAFNQDQVKKYM